MFEVPNNSSNLRLSTSKKQDFYHDFHKVRLSLLRSLGQHYFPASYEVVCMTKLNLISIYTDSKSDYLPLVDMKSQGSHDGR